jgi:arylsulfatase A-like enzyme
VSEIDVLPTLLGLAGGTLPTDNRSDGQDIWPLLAGRTRQSPHPALYYFKGNRLEAVRAGEWKLRIAGDQLFNLDRDIGEKTNVATQAPQVVARLKKLIEQMDADLGLEKKGPGVRQPGRVDNPQPLLKRARNEYQ